MSNDLKIFLIVMFAYLLGMTVQWYFTKRDNEYNNKQNKKHKRR